MKLLTLSEFITNEANKVLNRDKDFMTKEEFLRASVDVIFAYNHLLKKPLTLSMFVPCKDAKPLEKPENYSFFETYTVSYLPKQKPSYYKACHAYQEAEKAVIFEGFEISAGDNPEYFYFRSNDYLVSGFHCDGNKPDVNIASVIDARNIHVFGEGLNTVSDLAEATKDNPLTLCKQSD